MVLARPHYFHININKDIGSRANPSYFLVGVPLALAKTPPKIEVSLGLLGGLPAIR